MDSRDAILVLEDQSLFRDLQSRFLATAGRVVTAANASEGLAAARRERPVVIVAALDLADSSGEAVCKEIKADPELCEIAVILVVQSSSAGDDRERAIRAGADDVIAKPITRTDLIQAVARFVRFSGVRSLVRVPMETEVVMGFAGREMLGVSENISRGGIFVASDRCFAQDEEINVEFRLPDSALSVVSTARIAWSRSSDSGRRSGNGMQFLAQSAAGMREISDYVYERATSCVGPWPPDATLRSD